MVTRAGATLVAILALAPTARATPPDTIGFGSRSTALAGAVGADVEDWTANYYNPAGLVRDTALRLGGGYVASRQEHEINGVDSRLEPIRGTSLGFAAPAQLAGIRFAFGLGLHLNDQRLSRTRSAVLTRPRWELYDTRPHRVWLTANFALRPVDWLLIGAGITFNSPSELRLDIRGTGDLIRPEVNSRLEHQFAGDLRSIRYPIAGVQILPHEQVSIGATYRGEYQLENLIVAEVDAAFTGFGDPVPAYFLLEAETISTFGPQQLDISVAWQPNERLRIGFDLTWVDWSEYESPIADQTILLELEVPPALRDTIMVPDSIEVPPRDPLGLKDRFVPRVGVEYLTIETEALELRVRGGYFYERSPFPEQRGSTSFVDNDRHAFTVGAGLVLDGLRPTLPGWLRFDAHFGFAFLPERVHEKDSLVHPVGDFTASGHQLSGGLDVELAFE